MYIIHIVFLAGMVLVATPILRLRTLQMTKETRQALEKRYDEILYGILQLRLFTCALNSRKRPTESLHRKTEILI